VGATGEKMRLLAGDPFATFWRETKDVDWWYAAYMTTSIEPGVCIDGTDFAVATVGQVGKGKVVLLPQPGFSPYAPVWADDEDEDEDEDADEVEDADEHEDEHEDEERAAAEERRAALEKRFLDALFELIEALRTSSGDYHLPEWTERYLVPQEDAAKAELMKAEERLAKLAVQIDKKKALLAKINEKKLLFAGSGKAFESLAEQAFRALGCEVEHGRPGRTDRIIRNGDVVAVTEMKGKGKSASEADAAQLEKWVTEHRLEHEQDAPKGILIVNAWRNKPLEARTEDAFPPQMLPYAEKRDHCLMTGLQLLGAWLDAEAHPESKDEIAASIFDCVGVYDRYLSWADFLTAPTSAEADVAIAAPSPRVSRRTQTSKSATTE
jgi:hypothetical protein